MLGISGLVILWSVATLLTCQWSFILGRLDATRLKWLVTGYDVVVLLASYPLAKSRLRDLSLSTAWARWAAFPLTAGVMLPMLCLWSGARWENANGPAPEASSLLRIVGAVAAAGLALLLLYPAIRAYADAQARFSLAA